MLLTPAVLFGGSFEFALHRTAAPTAPHIVFGSDGGTFSAVEGGFFDACQFSLNPNEPPGRQAEFVASSFLV
jgi:hypothetical protein